MARNQPDILAEHLSLVPVHRALIRTLEHRLFARQTLVRPVLDIGCGDGHFAALAFPGGIDVGVDVSEKIVAEARRNGPYGRVEVIDGSVLPYSDGTFCTVVSNCVLEHVADVESLVGEVARVLARGGRFIFSVMNDQFTGMLFTVRMLRRMGLDRMASRYGRWWNRRAVHIHMESPEVWRARLVRHGLSIESQTSYMSLEATRAFELAHYAYAIPALLWYRLTGRWSMRCNSTRSSLAHKWLKPYSDEPWPVVGSCTFFVAHR